MNDMENTAQKTTVGLVEDDVPYRFYLAALLESSGRYDVSFAVGSVVEGVAAARQYAPRLLLLDLRLPEVGGAEGIERFAASVPATQVLVLTSVDRDDTLLDCIRAGAVGYLLKGIGSDELLRGLDEAVAGGAPMSPTIARRLLGLPWDATGALRVYRLARIPREIFERVESRGYAFFFESLFLLSRNGTSIGEVPIVLPARTYGHSKMSFREASRSLRRVVEQVARVDDGVEMRIVEHRDRVALAPRGVDDTVRVRAEPVVGPARHQVADVDDQRIGNRMRGDPLA